MLTFKSSNSMSMYESIHEPVKVLVSFNKNKVKPRLFAWRNHTYRVDKVNLIYSSRVGDHKVYYFSVSNHENTFKLSYDSKSLEWQLEELYVD